MAQSRRKGKRGELEARNAVRQHWYSPQCERASQVSGKFSADLIHGPPGLHIEVKYHQRISALKFLKQATRDARDGDVPVVLMRENNHPGWVVMFKIRDTDKFCVALANMARNTLP